MAVKVQVVEAPLLTVVAVVAVLLQSALMEQFQSVVMVVLVTVHFQLGQAQHQQDQVELTQAAAVVVLTQQVIVLELAEPAVAVQAVQVQQVLQLLLTQAAAAVQVVAL
jgi:hypothetical protein